MERAKGLGVIKVVVATAKTGQRFPRIQVAGIQSQDRELPEKALKGRELSHQGSYVLIPETISLDSLLRSICSLAVSTAPAVLECTTLHNQNTLGTIFFHYRSRGMPVASPGDTEKGD